LKFLIIFLNSQNVYVFKKFEITTLFYIQVCIK
jgi:hypothetical protein